MGTASNKMPPWSFTALSAYENCPRRYYMTRVSKEVVEPPGEAAMWGDRVHKALEQAVLRGTPLPEGMEQWQKYPDKFRKEWNQPGVTVITEKQLAVNKFFTPTKWMAKDAWCRGIVDIAVLKGDTIIACDWKTGKRKPELTQMQLFAGLLFAHFPAAQKIKTMFIWLKELKADREEFHVERKGEIWNAFLPRVQRMEQAFITNKWEARPSGLCNGWCPCSSCEYHKPRRS